VILFKVTIPGRSYVKKNNAKVYGKRLVYSKNYINWRNQAHLQIALAKKAFGNLPLNQTLNLKVVCYFEHRQAEPDLSALYEGVQDELQAMGVIENDKLIIGHDGSTKIFYSKTPRMEVEITARQALEASA
jgi:Holliday junction resolvase RusA-like endonuclease